MINNISSANLYQNELRYNISQEKLDEIKHSHDHLVPKTPKSQLKMFSDKFINAFTIYPAKGLTGNKNSNFYEFLTMGMVPYTVGSLTLMALFNSANKHFKPSAAKSASKLGTKMALGVLFYGLGKELSKHLIAQPVKATTGVDINMPYQKWVNEFATSDDAPSPKSVEYHKVFESVDFPRYDLLYYQKNGEPRNYYYDKVAKKLGKGDNLEASDQEVKPKIKEILIRSKAATAISSFLWAAVGVMYAAQDAWGDLFNKTYPKQAGTADKGLMKNIKSFYSNKMKPFVSHAIDLGKKAGVELWQGSGKNQKANAIAGRTMLTLAALSSIVGVLMTVIPAKQSTTQQEVIDKNKNYTVN